MKDALVLVVNWVLFGLFLAGVIYFYLALLG